jgi:hypothetical protein
MSGQFAELRRMCSRYGSHVGAKRRQRRLEFATMVVCHQEDDTEVRNRRSTSTATRGRAERAAPGPEEPVQSPEPVITYALRFSAWSSG